MNKANQKETDLAKLGEFGLINRLAKDVRHYHKSTVKGIGDDAAVLRYGTGNILVTTDLLVEGVHFNLTYVPLKHLGYKAVVVNLSDICAMNAEPRQITVSIAVSNRFTLEMIDELYKGIRLACERYKVDLAGGDTSSSFSGLMISITALGEAPEDKIAYRSGAGINDLICVSGDLGGAYMGLQLLEREKEVFKANPNMQPDFTGYDYILERQLKPEARNDIVALLSELKIKPTAMIDVSDGLSSDMMHICECSQKGCAIYEDKIPLDASTIAMAEEFGIDPVLCALNGGEDYELLFTLPLKTHDLIKKQRAFSVIGHITEPDVGRMLIGKSGGSVPLQAQGWNALSG